MNSSTFTLSIVVVLLLLLGPPHLYFCEYDVINKSTAAAPHSEGKHSRDRSTPTSLSSVRKAAFLFCFWRICQVYENLSQFARSHYSSRPLFNWAQNGLKFQSLPQNHHDDKPHRLAKLTPQVRVGPDLGSLLPD